MNKGLLLAVITLGALSLIYTISSTVPQVAFDPRSQTAQVAGSSYHPADVDSNWSINQQEMGNYSYCWKSSGCAWPSSPSVIPLEYMGNSAFLWKSGESYHFDSSQACPGCWVEGPAGATSGWPKGFGGVGSDGGTAVAADSVGNIFAAGTFSGSFTFGTTLLTSVGGRDLFLAKFSSDGTLQWVKSYGSTGNEAVIRILLDKNGNIFLSGLFTGSGSFGGTTTTASGSSAGFIAKYSPQGAHLWSRTLDALPASGAGTLSVVGMALDNPQQNVIVTGYFQGTATLTPTATFSSQNGGQDSYLAKYSAADGAPVWAKTYSSADYDTGSAVFVDQENNIIVAGVFAYRINLGLGDLASDLGTRNFYIGKFADPGLTAPGTALWAKKYGALSNNTIGAAALDSNGDLVLGGTFISQTDLGGGTILGKGSISAFLAKYSGTDGRYLWARPILAWTVDPKGLSFDSSKNPVLTGNFAGTGVYSADFGGQILTAVGSTDIFVAKYSGTFGALAWAKSFGGTGVDSGTAIAVDQANLSVAIGYFSDSANFETQTLTSAGSIDIFLSRFK